MSIEAPAKRQRTVDGSARSPNRSPSPQLSADQLRSIRHAQYLDNGIIAAEQLESLASGATDLGQIAWSPQNVIATASNTQASSSGSGHVIIQYPASVSGKQSLRSCYLYPHQSNFSTAPAAGPSQPRLGTPALHGVSSSRYGDPRQISFSPCGYYLCAYFPDSGRNTKSRQTASGLPTDGAMQVPPNGMAPGLQAAQLPGQLPGAQQLTDPPLPAAQDASATAGASDQTTGPSTGKLCFWSRAETGALNDWELVQVISVKHVSDQSLNGPASKPGNVLKVNDKGQQIVRDASRASLTEPESSQEPASLSGGVKHIVWLNRRRRIVLESSSPTSGHYGANPFRRLPQRGPCSLSAPSATADDAGPDREVALLVFGHHGQVTLLSSRKAERDVATNIMASSLTDNDSSNSSRPGFLHTILQSSLYTPELQPSPITLDSAPNVGERPSSDETSYTSIFSTGDNSHDISTRLTHLAVGMPANDPVLLVASKRASSPSTLIDLTEITVDLRADAVTMITRPLQPASLLPSATAPSNEGQDNGSANLEAEAASPSLDELSILTWAEMGSKDSDEARKAGKAGALRLVACSSHVGANGSEASSAMRSNVVVWDLCKAEGELSDAFASLECRKTGQAPKWRDWQLRFAQSKTISGKLITSLVTNADGLPVADFAILTALVPAAGKPGLLSEQLSYFDLKSVDMVDASTATMPARALSRSSSPCVSSNGALIATLSNLSAGAALRGIVMWKLPWHSIAGNAQSASGADETRSRMSQLLALSCLRKSDAIDISRAYGSAAVNDSGSKLLIEVADLLKITDSKRQDVLVKIEGATQKGPSHDSNTIPFHHALRLLKIRMAVSTGAHAKDGAEARLERMILELGLCYQVLRLARIQTQVTITPPAPAQESKKKSGTKAAPAPAPATSGETRTRVYYRLESVWPLLAQLQWFLTLLDGVSKLALASSASDASFSATSATKFEEDFVRMLNKPTPRRLVLQVVAHFCDFQDWILSTMKKENLPPATGASVGDEAMAFFASSSQPGGEDGRVLAVSEQMELARDALRLVVGDGAVDLGDFAACLAKVDAEATSAASAGGREADRFWWANLGGKPGMKAEKQDGEANIEADADAGKVQAKLLNLIVDPESGALVDVLTLFVSPSDISDERNVVYEKSLLDDDPLASANSGSNLNRSLAAMSAKRTSDDLKRDIVRKVSLRSAVTQAAILNEASSLLRSNPSAPRTQNADGSSEVKLSLMRAKRCVRCHALSQDPVTATYAIPAPVPSAGMVVDPTLPPQVQMQMQMQVQMQMQMQMIQQQQQQQQQKMQQQMQMQMQAQGQGMPAQPMAMGMGMGMPFMPILPQPQPKLTGVEVAAQAGNARFKFACLCGGAWWVL